MMNVGGGSGRVGGGVDHDAIHSSLAVRRRRRRVGNDVIIQHYRRHVTIVMDDTALMQSVFRDAVGRAAYIFWTVLVTIIIDEASLRKVYSAKRS